MSLVATGADAQDRIVTPYDGTFEDARFCVENAIVNEGPVIDHVSRVGDMLNRTGADVGSEENLSKQADIITFCSALVSRQVMEAGP